MSFLFDSGILGVLIAVIYRAPKTNLSFGELIMARKIKGYSQAEQVFSCDAAKEEKGIVYRSIASLGKESSIEKLVNYGVGQGYAWTVAAGCLIFDCSGELQEGFRRDLYNRQTFPYDWSILTNPSRQVSAVQPLPTTPSMGSEDVYQKLRELIGIAAAEARLSEFEKRHDFLLDQVATYYAEAIEHGCEIKQCDYPELTSKIEKKLELKRSSRSRSTKEPPGTTTHCGSEPNLHQLAGNHSVESKAAGNIAPAPTIENVSDDAAITYGHIAT